MGTLRSFASRRPLLFVILLILSALVIVDLAATLVVILFRVDRADPILALSGYLTATLFLVFLLRRFGWLKAAGVASWACWKGWIVGLALLVYYLLALTYSFFGEFSFSVPPAAVGGLRVPSVFIGGVFEEVLFRGAILFTLVSVWGTTRRGTLQAVATTSLLFGLVHLLNAVGGDPSEVPGQMAIALLEGIWWAALVLRWGSIWPAVLIHVVTNWALQTKALGLEEYHGAASSYALATLLGLPLAILGVWWILRIDPWDRRGSSSSDESHGTDASAGT